MQKYVKTRKNKCFLENWPKGLRRGLLPCLKLQLEIKKLEAELGEAGGTAAGGGCSEPPAANGPVVGAEGNIPYYYCSALWP